MGVRNGSGELFALVTVGLMVVLATPVSAQTDLGERLNLDGLIDRIVNQNARLSAKELRVKEKYQLIESAGALDDPRVSYSIAPSSVNDAIPSDFGNALGFRQVFQFSQSIPWPGKLSLRAEVAEAEAQLEGYSRDELFSLLVHRGRELWLDMWWTAAAQRINAEQQALLGDLDEVVGTRYANGLGLQQHVLDVASRRIQLTHREFVLAEELRRLRVRINELLNRSPGSPLGELPETLPAPILIPPEEIISRVLADSPELLQLRAQERVAQSQWELIELDDYPDLQVNAGYNELWNDPSMRTQIGVSVNIPLDFGKRAARKAAARYRHASVAVEISRLEIELEAQVEQLLSRYEELSHSIMLFEEELLPTAEQTLEAGMANYESGGGEFQSLIEAQEQILTLSLQLEQMRVDRIRVVNSLDRTSGGHIWPRENGQ